MKSGMHESNNIFIKFYHWIKIRKNKYCMSFCPTCEFWEICQADVIAKEQREKEHRFSLRKGKKWKKKY